MIGRFLFRAILVIVGAVSAYVSINVAFGGLHTLGWQGATDYVTVTDDATYALGAFLILAATNPQRFRGGLALAFALVSVGGARPTDAVAAGRHLRLEQPVVSRHRAGDHAGDVRLAVAYAEGQPRGR